MLKDLFELPHLCEFEVLNGNWKGIIYEKEGKKFIHHLGTGMADSEITPGVHKIPEDMKVNIIDHLDYDAVKFILEFYGYKMVDRHMYGNKYFPDGSYVYAEIAVRDHYKQVKISNYIESLGIYITSDYFMPGRIQIEEKRLFAIKSKMTFPELEEEEADV